MSSEYLYEVPRGRWAIRRRINGRWVDLIQDSYLDHPEDAAAVLLALHIAPTQKNLDHYFPLRGKAGRCPTLELLELTSVLEPTIPQIRSKKEDGV